MVSVRLELKGLQELQGKLKEKNITQPLAEGIKKATILLDREVKMATPVDTGRLRASMTSKFASDFGQVGTLVEYAPAVEYGRGAMEARHMEGAAKILGKGMFTYALEKLKDKMKDLLGDVANKIETRWR